MLVKNTLVVQLFDNSCIATPIIITYCHAHYNYIANIIILYCHAHYRYIKQTHGRTHTDYTLSVTDVFEVDKQKEKDNFKDFGNRQLLWHGSRLANWVGIINQGLRIAPPEAPVTGYMVCGCRGNCGCHSDQFYFFLVRQRSLFC